MPIYEYSCRKCGARVEALQKVSDKPLARHAKCGGKLEKEWSQTSFQLKGTGWYVTDYSGRKGEAKEGAEAKSETADVKATSGEKSAADKSDGKKSDSEKSDGKKTDAKKSDGAKVTKTSASASSGKSSGGD